MALLLIGSTHLHEDNKALAVANVFPGSTWATTTPAEVGMDSAAVDAFVNSIDNVSGAAGVIVRNGYVIKSWGNQTTKFDWASAAKPVVSTLLLFAVNEGKLASTDALIGDEGWALTAADASMTYHHLANMISGYMRTENPGEAWAYNDYAVQLYVETLFDRVYETTADAAATDPSRLGALQFEDGTIFSSRDGYGVSTTPRDFARIGWFWANKGNWNGTQLLPESYFDSYMKNHVTSTIPRSSAQDPNYLSISTYGGGTDQSAVGPGFYGYGWWFNTNQDFWPDAPADTLQANGHFGTELVVVIPSLDLVVAAKGSWGAFDPGNENATLNQNLKMLVDSIPAPSLSLDSFSSPTPDTTPAVTGTAADEDGTIASVEYQADSEAGSWSPCTANDGAFDEASEAFTCTVSPALSEGSHTVYVRGEDEDGTQTDVSSATFVVDTSAPSIAVTAVSPDPTTDSTPAVGGIATESVSSLSSVEYQVDSVAGSWSPCTANDGAFDEASEAFTCTVSPALSEGSHTVYVRGEDEDSTQTDAGSVTFIVDTSAPSIAVTAVSPDPTTDSTPAVGGTATESVSSLSSVEYQVDSVAGSWSPCTANDGTFDEASEAFTCTVSPALSEGSHTVYVRGEDAAGNVTAEDDYGQDAFAFDSVQRWTQTDWSGGEGQLAWSDATKFNTSAGVATSTAGQISLEVSGQGGEAEWYGAAWQYRKPVTISESQVAGSGTHTDFPVLISITDTDLMAGALANGFDIVFTSDDAVTKLSHEIESYDSATGVLAAWVKVPSLSATQDTSLYMYYGNPDASDQQNAAGVWDSGYQAVWHMSEASGTRSDSTANANTLTDNNTVPQAAGKIGYGTSYDNSLPESLTRTNASLNVTFPGKVASPAATASTWVSLNHHNIGHAHNMIVKGTSGANFLYVENQSACFNFGGASACTSAGTVPLADTWYHLATVYDGANVTMYINGTSAGTPTALAAFPTNTTLLTLGRRSDLTTTRALSGKLDEARISNIARSADWIATEYNNQSDPETFHSVGAEQQNLVYAVSGSLVSSIFDAGSASTWGALTYSATTTMAATAEVRVRTSNSSSMAGAPSFDSCDPVTSGADISSNGCVTDGHRYVQYQADLATSNTSATPYLQDVTLEYDIIIADLAPSLSLDSLSSPTTDTTPAITGTAADEDGTIASVEYQADSEAGSWSPCTANDGTFDEASEAFTCTVSPALSEGSHTVYVRGEDEGANLSDVASSIFSVESEVGDVTAPSSIGAPSFGAITTSSITVIQPDTVTETGSGLYQWKARRNGSTELAFVATTTPSAVDSSLSANTQYSYDVQFKDNAGNISSYGTAAQKYTLAPAPADFEVSTVGYGSVTLEVESFPNDTVGSSGYYFSRSGVSSGWIQANSWQDSELSCGDTNMYEVKYRNAEGVETSAISVSGSTDPCEASSGGRRNNNDSDDDLDDEEETSAEDGEGSVGTPVPPAVQVPASGQNFTSGNSSPSPGGSSFSPMPLKAGTMGIEVKNLQIFLNQDPDTQIAVFGPGSPGNETNFFGPLTKAAVIRFQEKYAAEILAPWGLTRGTGFVGETTLAKINQILAVKALLNNSN